MEFRILGPLEVTSNGEHVAIRGRHHPKLLALLLTDAGRMVPAGRLIEALWEDDPPQTAGRQLQNIAGALRKQLSAAAGCLEMIGKGYRLTVADGDLDLTRYRALVAEAHRRREAGRLDSARDRLVEALGEWRGPALVGLSGRLIESVAARLDESRLATIEERIDIDLELGRGPDLVGELGSLQTEHPARQRFAAQFMLALHRSGRTAEALTVYDQTRRLIGETPGLDPDQPLRELHSAILRDDPALVTSVDANRGNAASTAPHQKSPTRPGQTTPPAQLPADIGVFSGRHTELTALDSLTVAKPSAIVVCGTGGIGKTALSVHWAHSRRERFPDGQLYINLRGYDRFAPVTAGQALTRLIRSLGLPPSAIPTDVDDLTGLYRSLLAERRMLVLLDNAHTPDQVRPLLPGTAESLALVTSRDRLSSLVVIDDARSLKLNPLSGPEAESLLADVEGTERLFAVPGAPSRLARLCGHTPLALRIAAANLASRPYEPIHEFLSQLEGHGRLDALAIDGDPDTGVSVGIDLSIDTLDPDTRQLFFRLGSLPGEDFPLDMVVAIADRPVEVTTRLLDRLISAHLVTEHRARRFVMHDLVREYARQRAPHHLDTPTRAAVETAIIDWHYSRIQVVTMVDYPNLVAAIQKLRHHGQAWKLASTLSRLATTGFDVVHIRELVGPTLDTVHATATGEPRFRAYLAQSQLAWSAGQKTQAIDLARQALTWAGDDERGVARGNLGLALHNGGQYTEAETHMREALAVAQRIQDQVLIQKRTGNLGALLRSKGDYAEAELLLRQAVEQAAAIGMPTRKPALSLAMLQTELGRYEPAQTLLEGMLATDPQVGTHHNEMMAAGILAQIHHLAGRFHEAESALLAAAEIADRTRRANHLFGCRLKLADLYSDFGRPEEASQTAAQAFAMDYAEFGEKLLTEVDLLMSKLHTRNGEPRLGLTFAQRARDRCEALSHRALLSTTLIYLADIHRALADKDEAKACRSQATALLSTLGIPIPAGIAPIMTIANS